MSADDGSEAPEPEADTGRSFAAIEGRLEGYDVIIDRLESELAKLQAEKEDLRRRLDAETDARREAEARFQQQINEIDERTDMLRLVDSVDAANGEQRSRALLQHVHRKAIQKLRDGRKPVVRINRESAATALHHPDIDRTTYYADMERVARFVDDKTVCRYEDGELWYDLSEVSRPLADCGSSTTDLSGLRGEEPSEHATQHINPLR